MTKFLLVLENFNIPAGSDYEYVVIAIIGQANISCHQKSLAFTVAIMHVL